MKVKMKKELNYKYPVQILKRQVQKNQQLMNEGRFIGQLQGNDEVVSLKNVTHRVNSVQFEQNGDVIIDVELLSTPMGKQVKDKQFEIAPRGFGTIDKNGVIQDDYTLVCFDIVMKRA